MVVMVVVVMVVVVVVVVQRPQIVCALLVSKDRYKYYICHGYLYIIYSFNRSFSSILSSG